ncbi:MAG: glycine cleavage system aminomethyltransferase GcvT [SAR324 cluster bacterium]|nr:glycine cleavage system aminomethyltransferase GcvT [SAR324 cluster bacterium]MBL7035532.1 glycine cleavage system aminomethyltransferase GcvT [SAR324 cluster bacterium]
MKTPLNAWHKANAGKMVDFGGWDMPIQYAPGIIKEHLATRRFAGLFDVSHMGRFRISGKDTLPFLQYLLTNNAENLAPWEAQYTLIANENGGLLDDAYLFRQGDEYFLVVNASNREKDWEHFQLHSKKFDVTLCDETAKIAMLALQGPLAEDILAAVTESGTIPEPQRNKLAEVCILETKVLISRTGYTGEPLSFELFVAAEKTAALWELLEKTGRKNGLLPIGLGARDTLRLEAGMPLYGHEFGIDTDGKEIPAYAFPLTSYAVKFDENKGDFIGREALLQQYQQVQKIRASTYSTSNTLPRRVMSLVLKDRGVTRQGDAVFLGEKKVGVVSSGTMVPYWKMLDAEPPQISEEHDRRAIALVYIDASLKVGQQLEIEIRSRRLQAELVRRHGNSNSRPYFQAQLAD